MNEAEWEQRISEAWESFERWDEAEFVVMMEELCAQAPAACSAASLFELGGTHDSTDSPEAAVALYRQALAAGLDDDRRRRATIQLASSLRNLGRADESLRLLSDELAVGSEQLQAEVRAFLALALADLGREREAVSQALTALAPRLSRYQRSLANYAEMLLNSDESPD